MISVTTFGKINAWIKQSPGLRDGSLLKHSDKYHTYYTLLKMIFRDIETENKQEANLCLNKNTSVSMFDR